MVISALARPLSAHGWLIVIGLTISASLYAQSDGTQNVYQVFLADDTLTLSVSDMQWQQVSAYKRLWLHRREGRRSTYIKEGAVAEVTLQKAAPKVYQLLEFIEGGVIAMAIADAPSPGVWEPLSIPSLQILTWDQIEVVSTSGRRRPGLRLLSGGVLLVTGAVLSLAPLADQLAGDVLSDSPNWYLIPPGLALGVGGWWLISRSAMKEYRFTMWEVIAPE